MGDRKRVKRYLHIDSQKTEPYYKEGDIREIYLKGGLFARAVVKRITYNEGLQVWVILYEYTHKNIFTK